METGNNAHFDVLKTRYRAVLDAMKAQNFKVDEVRQDGMKLVVRATAPSDQAKNQLWDLIKQSPNWQNDLMADIRVDPNAPKPAAAPVNLGPAGGGQQYTVKSGDTLSKIAKQFYGEASKYNQIFEANRNILKNADEIQVGQVLVIPAEK